MLHSTDPPEVHLQGAATFRPDWINGDGEEDGSWEKDLDEATEIWCDFAIECRFQGLDSNLPRGQTEINKQVDHVHPL
jgi:hypothetical protein